jgi:hypothetical protein
MPAVYEVDLINDMGHLTFANTPDLLSDSTLERKILMSGLFNQIRGAIEMYNREHFRPGFELPFISMHYALAEGHPVTKEYDVIIDDKPAVIIVNFGSLDPRKS